jgi:hypothetical protein
MLVSNKKWKIKKDYVKHDTPSLITQKMHNIFAWIIKFNVLLLFPFFCLYFYDVTSLGIIPKKYLTFTSDMLVENFPNYKKLVK